MKKIMLNEIQLAQLFKTDILPIKNWDGKPLGHSNLKQWGLNFSQRYGNKPIFTKDTLINGKLYKAGTPYYNQFGLESHNGNDIAGMPGAPIVASHDLWLTETQNNDGGYGLYVRGETETKKVNGEYYKLQIDYGHFRSISVRAGKWVKKGDDLGELGSTGFSTGPHLHYGIRPWWSLDGNNWSICFSKNGNKGWIDPQLFIPHIIWDLDELMDYIDYTNLKHMEGALIVEGEGVGRKGIVINGALREITKERAAEACLYYLARKEGKFIDTKAFNNMPKGQNF